MTTSGLSAGVALAAGAVGTLALIILYLAGRRAVRLVVPFAGPWLAASTTRAGRLGRRVRWLASLALQVAILAAIVVAATDWASSARQPGVDGAPGRTVALVLDRSASMQALDEPGSRMLRARALAREAVAALGPRDRAVVISFAAEALAHSGLENDPARLLAAIDSVEASEQPGDLTGALNFAGTLLRGRAHPTVIIFGDGGGPDIDAAAVEPTLRAADLRFVPVGRRARNLAIVAFSARRQPGDASSAELSVVLQSFQDAPADVELNVTAGAQQIPIARRRVHLPARGRVAVALPGVPVPDPRLEARLANTRDDLPLDDRAFAVVPAAPPLSVLVVGSPDLYLEGALLSLGATVKLQHAPVREVEADPARLSAADVVILHGVTPRLGDTGRPAARALYLDPSGPANPWRERPGGGEARDPIVAQVAREHPLLRGLSLADVNVLGARRLVPGTGDTVVAATVEQVPLLLARERAGARAVALAFDPRRSDLPLRSAFPLLLANALDWLARRPDAGGLSWPTGRTVTVEVPGAPQTSYEVRGPDGARVATTAVAGGVRTTLDRTGIFTVAGKNAASVTHVAANLASTEESELAPHARLRLGDRTLPPPDRPAPRSPWQRPHPQVLALLVALALCTGEWLTHHRRVTV